MPDRKDLDFHLETAGGVPYRLQPGYPKISCKKDGVTGTEVYIIPANEMGNFYFESMPGVRLLGNVLQISAGRAMPGTNFLVTKRIDFEPWQGDVFPGDPFEVDKDELGVSAWKDTYSQYLVATIEYETSQVDDENDDQDPNETNPEAFLEHSINTGGQILAYHPVNAKVIKGASISQHPEFMDPLNLPAEGADDGQQNENKDPSLLAHKVIHTIEHNLKWRFVLNPDWDAIRDGLGTLNNAAWPIFFDAPRGTVMFTGLSGSQQFLWTGRLLRPGLTAPGRVKIKPWSLDFKFSERHIIDNGETYGWNHVFSPSLGWILLTRLVAGNRRLLYDETNHLDLFKSASVIDS